MTTPDKYILIKLYTVKDHEIENAKAKIWELPIDDIKAVLALLNRLKERKQFMEPYNSSVLSVKDGE